MYSTSKVVRTLVLVIIHSEDKSFKFAFVNRKCFQKVGKTYLKSFHRGKVFLHTAIVESHIMTAVVYSTCLHTEVHIPNMVFCHFPSWRPLPANSSSTPSTQRDMRLLSCLHSTTFFGHLSSPSPIWNTFFQIRLSGYSRCTVPFVVHSIQPGCLDARV